MAKKRETKLIDPLIPMAITVGVLIFIAITWKYPSLILYEKIDMPNAKEAQYSDRYQSPYATARYWCEDGIEWVTLVEGSPVALVNTGLIEEGRYTGFCHATAQSPQINIDIYFNLKGSGYLVKEMGGKIQEIPFAN